MLSSNRFLGDTAFRFDFTFFVEEVDGLHRTQSAHVHCPSSQGDPEFPLGENRHKHHAHRTFYRGSPIPMSLRRDSLSLFLFPSLSLFSFPSCCSFSPSPLPSLYLSFAPCLVVEKRRSFCMLPPMCTHVRVGRHVGEPARTMIYMHDSLHSNSLSTPGSCPLPLHLSMQFSPLFRLVHTCFCCFTTSTVSIRFCFLEKRNRERNKRKKREKERDRSKMEWGQYSVRRVSYL